MKYFSERLEVYDLTCVKPDMETPYPLGEIRLGEIRRERGGMVCLNTGQPYEFAAMVEFLPGVFRGRHFHQKKREIFYIVSGQLEGIYWSPEEPAGRVSLFHPEKTLIIIHPGLCHEFISEKGAIALELATTPNDPTDTYHQVRV